MPQLLNRQKAVVTGAKLADGRGHVNYATSTRDFKRRHHYDDEGRRPEMARVFVDGGMTLYPGFATGGLTPDMANCFKVTGQSGISRRVLLGQLACLTTLRAQTDDDPLGLIRIPHPRLIVLDSELDKLRTTIRENPLARRIYSDLEKECDRLVIVPPVEYKLTGPRLLLRADRILDRVSTLAFMYRLTNRDPYLRRCIAELRSASNFRDWNPNRFTETAEMIHAFALGYDWLYSALSPEERASIRNALFTKGLDVALPLYHREGGWPRDRYYPNIICNSALGLGALAAAGDPKLDSEKPVNDKCAALLKLVVDSIPHGLATYGVEGSWPEGTDYWNVATKYACILFSGLQTALGNDYGLSSFHGVDRAGRFRIHTIGPFGKSFNFGDSEEDPSLAPEMFWLAKRFSNPVYAWSEDRALDAKPTPRTPHVDPYDLAWFAKDAKSPQQPPAWALDSIFRGVDVATMRSSWEDPAAIYVAVKGGDNKAAHAHLDLGSFVLDAGGVRWAADLGPDDYDLPGYLNPRQRWTYFRTRTEAHNTLLVDGENQDLRAESRITRQEAMPDLTWVQIELSRANPGKVKQWIRRVGLAQKQAILVSDSLHSDQPVEVIWGMLTDADITITGQTATLRKGGWNLSAEIRTPRHAVFDMTSVRISPPQAPNTGFRRLIVRLGDKASDLDLSIILTPWKDGQTKPKIAVTFPV